MLIEQGYIWNILWMISKPFMTFFVGIGSEDSFDLYWYNNPEAEGVHNYPVGIHKYYDVFSWYGYSRFVLDFILVVFFQHWTFMTLLPIDIWAGLYTSDTSNLPQAFIYYALMYGNPLLTKYLFWIINF